MAFFVYILLCSDNSYYVGHTDNIEQRISQHKLKACSGYTATRLPVTVVFVQDFGSRDEALIAERQIKGWSRKKKEALIKSDWATIIKLSNTKKVLK
jgi:predicted GIY-YIG superfamily endonuclease